MEAGAFKLLESATQRTLHAHAFSRSSSQASAVLTDLLSRYLTLLSSTCAKYAQHSGRTHLSVYDAIGALDELGVNLEELSDYCATEGKELNRYAHVSTRRMEDLNEFRSQISEGLRIDRDDAIPLVYEPVPEGLEDEGTEDEADESEDDEDAMDGIESTTALFKRPLTPPRPSTPPLPLSPVSNPSSPRKRPRISSWEPPEHIPEFLPPFPVTSDETPESPTALEPGPQPPTSHTLHSGMPPPSLPSPAPGVKVEKPPTSMTLLQQPVTTTAASDIFVQVPYSQSSLSSLPEWHLPTPHSSLLSNNQPQNNNRQVKLATPQTEHALLSAYHHILTNRQPPNPPPLNPARHKVALALMHDTQTNPKWTPADSLFGTVSPCPPRVAPIGPSFAIAIGEAPGEDGPGAGSKGKDGKEKDKDKDKDKDTKLPSVPPRPVVDGNTRMAPFVSQQTSRIPDLARLVLPSGILARTSRLSHPPPLYRGSQPVIKLSSAVPAPWNANPLPEATGPGGAQSASSGPNAAKGKEKDKEGSQQANGKDAPKPVLPDAKLYATWDYEVKDFTKPLGTLVRGRPRMASVQGGGGASGSGLVVNTRAKGIK